MLPRWDVGSSLLSVSVCEEMNQFTLVLWPVRHVGPLIYSPILSALMLSGTMAINRDHGFIRIMNPDIDLSGIRGPEITLVMGDNESTT